MADETTKKPRKGTALLAVMDENCSSCAGSPICEAHCTVDDCINLVYEELPQGGLKPYRVFVDNDKCIGCQMCYSDDLTKIHQHKETGEIYYEYASRFYDSNKKPIPPDAMPKIDLTRRSAPGTPSRCTSSRTASKFRSSFITRRRLNKSTACSSSMHRRKNG